MTRVLVTFSGSDFESLAGTKNKSLAYVNIALCIVTYCQVLYRMWLVEPVPQQRIVPHAKFDTRDLVPRNRIQYVRTFRLTY